MNTLTDALLRAAVDTAAARLGLAAAAAGVALARAF